MKPDDDRIKELNDQLQQEKDPAKIVALTEELIRLLDESEPPEKA